METAISANELMLGNWVMYKGEMCRVETISLDMEDESEPFINVHRGGNVYECIVLRQQSNELQPIPLSAELLENMEGCETLYKSAYTHKWDIEFDGRHICVTHHVIDGQWGVTFGSHIVLLSPYLHTLQNVIFLNWGKEITIEL